MVKAQDSKKPTVGKEKAKEEVEDGLGSQNRSSGTSEAPVEVRDSKALDWGKAEAGLAVSTVSVI